MGSAKRQQRLSSFFVNGVLLLLVLVWTIPTLGIFVSSFRNRDDIANSPWWHILPHKAWETTATLDPGDLGLDPTGVMEVEGVSGTFEELREGVQSGDTRVIWIGNRRLGRIEVQKQNWAVSWDFSLDNYKQVLGGQDFEFNRPDGTVEVVPGDNMTRAFLNSLAVAVP